jgi:putative membrane protein
MKHYALFAASFAALALAGCGKKAEPAGEASPSVAASDDLGVPSVSPEASAGQTFANTAAASDAFEIESSKLAATKAQSAKVKSFAEQMIKAHTESTAKLKTAAAAASPAITPVPQLSAMQQQTIDALSAKSGAEFDSAYAEAQTEAHQMTLDALKSYSATGEVPSLKAFATELVPTVTSHLSMAKALQP